MANAHFYGSVNGETKEAIYIYGAVWTLNSITGTVDIRAGNLIDFDPQDFYDYFSNATNGYREVYEGNLILDKIKITGTSSAYNVFLVLENEKEIAIKVSGSADLTRQQLYNMGVVVASGTIIEGDDFVNLSPVYSNGYTKDIQRMYCSVNGVTKLCYRKRLGTLTYYTSSSHTDTAKVHIYNLSDINNLGNSNNSWNVTIEGVTIANTDIKELDIRKSKLTQVPSYFMNGGTGFDTLYLPNTVTYIGQHFLDNCHDFNSVLDLSNVTFIGGYFMHECDNYNQPMTIPSSVTFIGDYFMYRCNYFLQPLTVECPASVITYDDHSLSTLVMSVPAYQTGHTLIGTYASEWKTKFPDRGALQVPYRKLLVA